MQHLEQEAKLEVGQDWTLPDLSGVLPGARSVMTTPLTLEATYYDTLDQRLAERHVTMRYRRESEDRGLPRRANQANRANRADKSKQADVAHIWTVKLPSKVDETALSRTEVNWSVDHEPRRGRGRLGPEPLPTAAQFVAGITMGEPLLPIARLVTARRRYELRTSDGRVLAEIAHDTVTGTCLLPPPPGAGRVAPVCFTEVEVELAEGSSLEVLQAVTARLVAAGAHPSSRRSKLMAVMAQYPTNATVKGTGNGPGVGTSKGARWQAVAKPTMANVLQQQARSALDVLLEHDPPIRLGDPDSEHVHRSRVATRRLRSVLRAFRPLVEADLGHWPAWDSPGTGDDSPEPGDDTPGPEGDTPKAGDDEARAWFTSMREELGWLGQELGRARDADVRLATLEKACAEIGPRDAAGSAKVLGAAREEQREAHEELLQAMAAERYMACLRSIEALARPPRPPATAMPALARQATSNGGGSRGAGTGPGTGDGRVTGDRQPTGDGTQGPEVPREIWARLAQPAATELPNLGHKQWRALRKAVRRLGNEPPDDALHQVRIQAKRLRYIAEVASPLVRPAAHRRAARRTVKAATDLQDVLGNLHDSAVNEQWLRDLAAQAPPSASKGRHEATLATALAIGQLVAAARQSQQANRQGWRKLWESLDDKSADKWAASGAGAHR